MQGFFTKFIFLNGRMIRTSAPDLLINLGWQAFIMGYFINSRLFLALYLLTFWQIFNRYLISLAFRVLANIMLTGTLLRRLLFALDGLA